MELSILVAKILSIIYISIGISLLIGTFNFNEVIDDFKKSPALMIISGYLAIFIGMILIEYHNIWVQNWIVLITIIGWISLIKGLLLIIYPKFILFYNFKVSRFWGIAMIGFGLLFGYFGFI